MNLATIVSLAPSLNKTEYSIPQLPSATKTILVSNKRSSIFLSTQKVGIPLL